MIISCNISNRYKCSISAGIIALCFLVFCQDKKDNKYNSGFFQGLQIWKNKRRQKLYNSTDLMHGLTLGFTNLESMGCKWNPERRWRKYTASYRDLVTLISRLRKLLVESFSLFSLYLAIVSCILDTSVYM